MATTNSHNYYVSHLRTGLAAKPAEQDGQRLELRVEMTLGAGTDTEVVKQPVFLYGPGDVLGFNEKAISKTEPLNRVTNFRTDLIPYIEFAEPDFLWRYSTAKANKETDWIPWLSLIVLKSDTEFTYDDSSNKELPPAIVVQSFTNLPDLSAAWRWAHIHLIDVEGLQKDAIAQILKSAPHKSVCRLMCPRKLKDYTRYTAFVVPTYQLGRKAALGEQPAADVTVVDLAWKNGDTNIKIPYYYSWTFETSKGGDFETLVRELKPQLLRGVGKRKIDCRTPGLGITTAASEAEMEMEGALQSTDMKPQLSGMDVKNSVKPPLHVAGQLVDLLNSSTDGKLRVVPPIYGRWYVSDEGSDFKVTTEQTWINELNLDFRHRAAAGLGVQYVKEHQEELMQSAWKQLAEIKKVNKSLNLGRFGVAVSDCIHKKLTGTIQANQKVGKTDLTIVTSSQLFRVSLIMGKKLFTMPASGGTTKTVAKSIETAELSQAATSLKTQKYYRKFRPLSGDTVKPTDNSMDKKENLLSKLFTMDGLISNEPPIMPKIGKLERINVGNQLTGIEALLDPKTRIQDRLKNQITHFRAREAATKKQITTVSNKKLSIDISDTDRDPLRDVIWYPAFHNPMYRYLRDKSKELLAPGLETVPQNTVSLLTTNRRFIEAFMMGLNHEFASELRWREFPTDMRGSYFRKFWDTSIYSVDQKEKDEFAKPECEIGQKLLAMVKAKYPTYTTVKSIEQVFNKPGALSESEKAIALAYENAIERWLLSRDSEQDIDYPVDWTPIDGSLTRLGEHPVKTNTSSARNTQRSKAAVNQIVLLIRGDLLLQYPNAVVYLTKKTDNTDKTFPIFEGHLPPDTLFLGFPISKDVAAQYYIVFEEPMDEIKYGLDATNSGTDWTNASWEHFVGDEGAYLNNNSPNPPKGLNNNPPTGLNGHWDNPSFIAKVFTQLPARLVIPLTILIAKEPVNK